MSTLNCAEEIIKKTKDMAPKKWSDAETLCLAETIFENKQHFAMTVAVRYGDEPWSSIVKRMTENGYSVTTAQASAKFRHLMGRYTSGRLNGLSQNLCKNVPYHVHFIHLFLV